MTTPVPATIAHLDYPHTPTCDVRGCHRPAHWIWDQECEACHTRWCTLTCHRCDRNAIHLVNNRHLCRCPKCGHPGPAGDFATGRRPL